MFAMTYGQDIRTALETAGLTQDQLAEMIGVSRVTVSSWINEGAAPTKKYWPAIEEALGIKLTLTTEQERAPYQLDEKYAFIPLLGARVSGGRGAENEFEEVDGRLAIPRSFLDANNLHAGALRVVQVIGSSMWPTMPEGNHVFINTADRRLRNGVAYAFRTEEGARIKRLFRQMDGRVRLVSDNPDKINYPDEWLTPGMEAEIIGAVVYRAGSV